MPKLKFKKFVLPFTPIYRDDIIKIQVQILGRWILPIELQLIDKIDMGPKTFTDTIQLKGVGIYLAF